LGFLGFLGNDGGSRGGDVGRVEKEQGRRENAVAGWRDEVVAGGLGAVVEVDNGGVVGRMGESGVGDLIDRKTRIIFGFAENARRKSFPAAAAMVVAAGGGWLSPSMVQVRGIGRIASST
nr:hypothetical protein [Tanacetum cinerariifolium]